MTRLNDAMDIVCYVRWLSFHDNFIYHMNVWLQMFSPIACNEACLDWWQCVKYFWSQIPGLLKIEKRERVAIISPTLEDHHSGEAVKKAKIKLVQWRMSLGNDITLWAELFRRWEKGKFTKMITSPLIFWNLLYFRWQIFANCECCHHHSLLKGHNVNVKIVVPNCQKCYQCLKCQVSGHKYRGLPFEGVL